MCPGAQRNGGGSVEGAVRYLTAEAVVDLFSALQDLAERDPEVRLEARTDYLLPIEELDDLCHQAEGMGLEDAAAYYLRTFFLLDLFPDGNARTGLLAAEHFLRRNGRGLEYAPAEAVQLKERLAGLRGQLYKRGQNENINVLDEAPTRLHELCRQFVQAHLVAAAAAR